MPKSKIAEMLKSDEQKTKDFQRVISLNILKLMLEKDLKQVDMERLTGIEQSNISKKLNCKTSLTLGDIVKFAKALKVAPADLTKEKAPDYCE